MLQRQEAGGQALDHRHPQGVFSMSGLCVGTALRAGLVWESCASPALCCLCKHARPSHVLGRHLCGLRSASSPGVSSIPVRESPALCLQVLWSLLEFTFSTFFSPREQVQGINPDLQFLDETASLSRELEALNSSLLITNTQYQSKKTQFETSRSTDLSGTVLQL